MVVAVNYENVANIKKCIRGHNDHHYGISYYYYSVQRFPAVAFEMHPKFCSYVCVLSGIVSY